MSIFRILSFRELGEGQEWWCCVPLKPENFVADSWSCNMFSRLFGTLEFHPSYNSLSFLDSVVDVRKIG